MTGSGMTQALDPQAVGELSPLALNHLLPERQALIGEFSPAYEAFREATDRRPRSHNKLRIHPGAAAGGS
jgi:hypothetical protein